MAPPWPSQTNTAKNCRHLSLCQCQVKDRRKNSRTQVFAGTFPCLAGGEPIS